MQSRWISSTQSRGRGSEPVDLLAEPADLRRWLVQAGLIDCGKLRRAGLNQVRHLREAIFVSMLALVEGGDVPASAVKRINDAAARPDLRPQFNDGVVEYLAKNALEAVLSTIATDAIENFDLRYRDRLATNARNAGCFFVTIPARAVGSGARPHPVAAIGQRSDGTAPGRKGRPAMVEKRVCFDFEIDFSNGGGIQGQGFRLDIDGDDISDQKLASYIVDDMRLLMVGEVRILSKTIIDEPHKRRHTDQGEASNMNGRININCPDVWSSPNYPMSQAVAEPEGRRVHLTGQVAWDANFNVLHKGDAGAQTKAAFDTIEKVLRSAGGTLDDIVTITTYYVRDEDKDAITDARRSILRKDFGPATTGIQVMKLWDSDLLVEITATAVIPDDRFRKLS